MPPSGGSFHALTMVSEMSKRAGVFLFLLLAALFLLVNRGAYQGYFQDDEIDNLSWAPRLPAVDYLKAALSPRF